MRITNFEEIPVTDKAYSGCRSFRLTFDCGHLGDFYYCEGVPLPEIGYPVNCVTCLEDRETPPQEPNS